MYHNLDPHINKPNPPSFKEWKKENNFGSDLYTRMTNMVTTFGSSAIGDAVNAFSPKVADWLQEKSGGMIPHTSEEMLEANRGSGANKWEQAGDAANSVTLGVATAGLGKIASPYISKAYKALRNSSRRNTLAANEVIDEATLEAFLKRQMFQLKSKENTIKAVRKQNKEILTAFKSPEGKRRLDLLGADTHDVIYKTEEALANHNLKYNSFDPVGGGTHYNSLRNRINIDPKDIMNSSNFETPKQLIEHEVGHIVTRSPKPRKDLSAYPGNLVEQLYAQKNDRGLKINKAMKEIVPDIKKMKKRANRTNYDYFLEGSQGEEPLSFLMEYRKGMEHKKIIPNRYAPIGDNEIKRFALEDPFNRINSFTDWKSPENFDLIKKWSNILPATAVGIAGLTNNKK